MHKRIGILGGLSPESTITYYQYIVRRYQHMFGDHSYPEIIIYSVSFQRFMDLMTMEKWDEIGMMLTSAIRILYKAGADFGIITTNIMHIVFDDVEKRSPIPLLSIIEATAEAVKKEKIDVVGLLGTRFTMEKKFYKEGLASHGIKTITPEKEGRLFIDRVIFGELCRGVIKKESRERFHNIIGDLVKQGADGIILGCTEIPLLLNERKVSAKLFNTATIHAEKALKFATNLKAIWL